MQHTKNKPQRCSEVHHNIAGSKWRNGLQDDACGTFHIYYVCDGWLALHTAIDERDSGSSSNFSRMEAGGYPISNHLTPKGDQASWLTRSAGRTTLGEDGAPVARRRTLTGALEALFSKIPNLQTKQTGLRGELRTPVGAGSAGQGSREWLPTKGGPGEPGGRKLGSKLLHGRDEVRGIRSCAISN
ncbi:conserved hypothetical protein [Coccidioides posadasii str. Silveira]|uniref:Uncharacterized protein n=1 Tax=Coccidioides posadasii (strain RMSCC 757 / Silveira) TaxID=443226 RepID=E9D4K4_COCPS|nr:conserved hypothetical protein [Coccidioides posadasii str. Silveira]